MQHVFISQPLYKPKGSREDLAKMQEITARLSDPNKFPVSQKIKLEEKRKAREDKLGGKYLQSGSLSTLKESKNSVFDRLYSDARLVDFTHGLY